jgi:nicotinamidase-related amidase
METDTGLAPGSLFDRDRSCLLVIDVQQYFLNKLPLDQRAPLVARIGWIMRVARALQIPVIATAEDIARDGPLVPELGALLPAGQVAFDKLVFGLYAQPDIRAAVLATGRPDFVLVGLETDVCIAHSALGLAAAGQRVAVLEDACGSPPPHHEAGLRRLRDAGVVVTTLKGMCYEWVRDLATYGRLRAEIGDDLPPGLTL